MLGEIDNEAQLRRGPRDPGASGFYAGPPPIDRELLARKAETLRRRWRDQGAPEDVTPDR